MGVSSHPVQAGTYWAQLDPQGPGSCTLKPWLGVEGQGYHDLGCRCLCLGVTLTLGRPGGCQAVLCSQRWGFVGTTKGEDTLIPACYDPGIFSHSGWGLGNSVPIQLPPWSVG